MNLPQNGRIVIVDDDINDIQKLMEALSCEGRSFSYFNGSIDTLPKAPLVDTFLMFLDLELDGSARGNDATQASQVMGVLNRILGSSLQQCSVVIIVWSNALGILKELRPRMEEAKMRPLAFFQIDKASCKSDGVFSTTLITEALNQQMKEIPSLDLLYYWDDIAGRAAAKVYKKILPSDNMNPIDINKRLNAYFMALAKAYVGKDVDENDATATVNMFNMLLANEIGKIGCGDILLDVLDQNNSSISLGDYASINGSINLSSQPLPFSCGSIHANPYSDLNIICFDIFQDIKKAKKHENYSKIRQVVCEVSTLCDVAQGRRKLMRFCSGVLVPAELGELIKLHSDYLYRSCLLSCKTAMDNQPFFLVLDFRKFFTVSAFEEEPELLFQLNDSLLMHIQNRLGRQVSNPGIIFADHSNLLSSL